MSYMFFSSYKVDILIHPLKFKLVTFFSDDIFIIFVQLLMFNV